LDRLVVHQELPGGVDADMDARSLRQRQQTLMITPWDA
jgi:hypothetical protein